MKQAKDFAKKTAGETFNMGDEEGGKASSEADALEQKIVLKIGRSKEKIKLKRKLGIEQTGNLFLDLYKKVNDVFINMGKVKLQEKAIFFRLLAVMVDAGIPIIKALQTLSDQSKKNPKFMRIIDDMAFRIESGESLSGSMEKHNDVFDASETGMIRSGEVSGHLNDILKDMARQVEKNARTVAKVKGALTYPIVVLTILFIVLFLMMVFIIPSIQELFEQMGATLPPITQFVISLSTFMTAKAIHIVVGITVSLVALISWKKTKSGKFKWDTMMLKLPLMGNLLQKATLAQFARSLGNLLGAGVSITQSLNIIGDAMKNDVYKKKIKYAGDDIKSGIPLAETFRNSKEFPIMLVNMIEIGEQTAQLETVTKKISTFYDEQVDIAVNSLTKVMEPIIMVFVGVAVGGLVAAVMLPILTLSDSIGGV